jgi:hypothetical protein
MRKSEESLGKLIASDSFQSFQRFQWILEESEPALKNPIFRFEGGVKCQVSGKV